MAPPVPAVKTRDSDFCSVNFLTYFFHIFNIVFLLSGAAVLAVGLWTVLYKHQFVSLLDTVTYALTAYALVAAGSLVLLVVILGCCGVWRENRCLLLVYTFLLLLIFLMEATAGLVAYVYQAQVGDELAVTLNATFLQSYRIRNEQTTAIDLMQQQLQCCGVNSFEDWRHSEWKRQSSSGASSNSQVRVPDTCCLSPSPGCGKSISPSNIYYAGCKDGFTDVLVEQLNIIGAIGLGICVVQVFGMVLSCCLYSKLRYVEDID